jgi:hypothetical protein
MCCVQRWRLWILSVHMVIMTRCCSFSTTLIAGG